MKSVLRFPSFQRGVAAVEFALLLTPLVLMVFGTTELGRAIYSYNTLDKTVRDAARHLSQHGPGDTVIATEARCLAVYGSTDCTGSVVAPGLTTGMANVLVQTPLPVSGMRFYGTAGGGLYRERRGTLQVMFGSLDDGCATIHRMLQAGVVPVAAVTRRPTAAGRGSATGRVVAVPEASSPLFVARRTRV